MSDYRYVFGPVPSRRFGRSLGVDLTPLKTCSLDCGFCQLGHTPRTTLRRDAFVPIGDVLSELRRWQAADGQTDFVTLAGSGEPTLHTDFGDVIRWTRQESAHRSLLLSNGSLMALPEVRREAAGASIVKLSLNAWDQASFERLMHPHPQLRFEAIQEGYRALREECTGELWLEVFVVPGINDAPDQIERIAELAEQVRPDVIQLNTAVRPAAERGMVAMPPERLEALRTYFRPVAESCLSTPADAAGPGLVPTPDALAALIRRHPMSAQALARHFGVSETEITPLLAPEIAAGSIRETMREGSRFYLPVAQ